MRRERKTSHEGMENEEYENVKLTGCRTEMTKKRKGIHNTTRQLKDKWGLPTLNKDTVD